MDDTINETIGIILCAKGGSEIKEWLKDPNPKSLYGSLVRRALCAKQIGGRIDGIIAYHGESDTKSIELARQWPEKFLNLIENIRSDLCSPALPVVFAQLARVSDERKRKRKHAYVGWDILKAHQAMIASKNIQMIKTDDLELMDGLHLCTKSQLALGKRFADAMHCISNKNTSSKDINVC